MRREILLSGLITAVGIALHNFPEGISVFLASMKSTSTGLDLAVAIALHNIPEGASLLKRLILEKCFKVLLLLCQCILRRRAGGLALSMQLCRDSQSHLL